MKKILLLIISLFIITVNISVKADSDSDGWYIPDLEDYTFFIPADSDDLLYRFTYYDTGETYGDGSLAKGVGFGVFQTSTGALNFEYVKNTIFVPFTSGIFGAAILGTKFGTTPLIRNLPSYVSYTFYNTTEYIGAIDIHVITYRLDFMGNYSMLLDDYVYDIVYTLEVMYELNIDYNNYDYILSRGYTIHWCDTSDNEEYELYTPFDEDDNLLLFQLKKLAGQENGFEQGYQDGYQDGFIDGEKSKIAKNNEFFYNNIVIWIPAVITVVALASIISYFGIKRKNE